MAQCVMKWKYKAASSKGGNGEMRGYQRYIEKQVKDRQEQKGEYADLPDFSGNNELREMLENDGDVSLMKNPEAAMKAYQHYMEYRNGSGGLFSDEGVDVKSLKKEMAMRDGIFWIPIVSMKEKDAKTTGMDSEQKWIEASRRFVHMAAKEMGLDEKNLRWVGAFHLKPESDQNKLADAGCMPHVHLVIWDESGKTPAKIRPKVFQQIRKDQRDCYMGDYLREQYSVRNNLRAEINQSFSRSMNDAADRLCDIVHDISVVTGGRGRLSAETFVKVPRQLNGIALKMKMGESLTGGEAELMKKLRVTTAAEVQQKARQYEDIGRRLSEAVDEILDTPEIGQLIASWEDVSMEIKRNDGEEKAAVSTFQDMEAIRKGLVNAVLNYAKGEFKDAGFIKPPSDKQLQAFEQKLAMGTFRSDTTEYEFYKTIEVVANMACYEGMPKPQLRMQIMQMIQRSPTPWRDLDRVRECIDEAYNAPSGLLMYTTADVWDAMSSIGYGHDSLVSLTGGYSNRRRWEAMEHTVGEFCDKSIFDITRQDVERSKLAFDQMLAEQQQKLDEEQERLDREQEEKSEREADKALAVLEANEERKAMANSDNRQ